MNNIANPGAPILKGISPDLISKGSALDELAIKAGYTNAIQFCEVFGWEKTLDEAINCLQMNRLVNLEISLKIRFGCKYDEDLFMDISNHHIDSASIENYGFSCIWLKITMDGYRYTANLPCVGSGVPKETIIDITPTSASLIKKIKKNSNINFTTSYYAGQSICKSFADGDLYGDVYIYTAPYGCMKPLKE